MLRWTACVLIVAGACGKSKDPEPAAPPAAAPGVASGAAPGPRAIAGCDPTKPLTEDQAFAAIGKHPSSGMGHADMSLADRGQGIYELGGAPCCDIPYRTEAYFWSCKVYDSLDEILHDLLLSRGWAKADPGKRVELAKAIDPLLGRSLDAAPKAWSPYKTFAPPTAAAEPDGSVKLVRWVDDADCGGQGCRYFYTLRETQISADAAVEPAKVLDRYGKHEHGYPDPKLLASCDPAKPPTRDYAVALYLKYGGEDTKSDKLQLVDLGHDLWALREPGYDGTPRTTRFVHRCKDSYSRYELIPDILADAGWAKADPPKREKIAQEVDLLLHAPVTTKPADWDPAHEFKPPAVTSTPDGGVTLTRWVQKQPEDGYIGGDDWKYSLEVERFEAAGTLGTGRLLEHYQIKKPPAP